MVPCYSVTGRKHATASAATWGRQSQDFRPQGPQYGRALHTAVHIDPNDDDFVPMIAYEGATHIVITMEVPKAALHPMQRFFHALLAITVAE
jgi:hypothetical protein